MSEQEIVRTIVDQIIDASVNATPRLIGFLLSILISLLLFRRYSSKVDKIVSEISENKRDRKLFSVMTKLIMATFLITLSLYILGFEEVATVLGTLSGVIILASSYALKEAIRELVAGMYLIHDEDFVEGNKVSASGVKGYIVEVGLRRTKIKQEDDDVTTVSNAKIEPKWTYHKASNRESQ